VRKKPSSTASVLGVVQGLRSSSRESRPLVVAGPDALVSLLVEELARGGVAAAVREQGPLKGAAALVLVLGGAPSPDDERLLHDATRARLPVVAVIPATAGTVTHVPYVLDENLVRVPGGAGFPLGEIAKRLARALGEEATPLAARLPVLREAVCEELIRKFARQNGVLGVAIFVPGADLPILTANQVRLVLRIADAHGFEIDRERLPEVLTVIASGFGFRALARRAIGYVPFVGWVVQGAVAYTATRAVGEAAVRYFERRVPVTRVSGERLRFPGQSVRQAP
jgi:uncharacterized protein (DUF697 family)